jgi:hypothetical protein
MTGRYYSATGDRELAAVTSAARPSEREAGAGLRWIVGRSTSVIRRALLTDYQLSPGSGE